MSRVSKLGRWVAGGLLGVAGAAAPGDEPASIAPAPRAVVPVVDMIPAPHAVAPTADKAPAPRTPGAKPVVAAAAAPFMPVAPSDRSPAGTPAPLPVPAPVPGPLPPGFVPPSVALPELGAPVVSAAGTRPGQPPNPTPKDTTRQPIDRLLEPTSPTGPAAPSEPVPPPYVYFPTLGFAGKSGVLPRSGGNEEFETVEDRWRIGFPEWDRYGLGHPRVFDYPYRLGRWFDPYNQNVLKGDYPIIGQHTFLEITGTNSTIFTGRMVPTATTPFESTARPFTTEFFGRPGQFVFSNTTMISVDLFQGDAAFKPNDWRLNLTPAVNVNTLAAQELAVVSPDVRKGLNRDRSWTTIQQGFAEYKLADLSPQYDFVSVRAGIQPFTSDFRGFIFSDVNRGVRLFGNLDGNRTQYNMAYFAQLEKDTNSQLNTFTNRNQNIVVANLYRQDFLFPGYTAEFSFHYNNDNPSLKFDKNGFLVRPDPVGVFQPHEIDAYYLGWAGDGHIDRFNISHAFYWVLGRDTMNPLAGQSQSISAQMAAVELSYDRDWARFRVSGLYQSGDGNANNGHATGFDGILDNQNFGGLFGYFRQTRIPLFGVGLKNDQSNFVDLRSSRIQGQSNFVNPGLWLGNLGVDIDLTPRLRSINNANVLWYDKTNTLETFLFQSHIDRFIGVDLGSGLEYRPRLTNNAIFLGGLGVLIPGAGFRELYNAQKSKVPSLFNGFFQMTFTF
ncbi:hypothetical protein [Frigoriglobus tundricola]|uniref:Alginate export domain-containing protein n=1 Tax=Frigoriglobus tundricola TaxID=2774151 RepID=A0A6M5YGC1_9BACT|nr:hypothetical protein [Frigoriglobus tundricola]QJW93048.1 hypothetical protein FTUN_0548 [Frigoriglobus tundricola]